MSLIEDLTGRYTRTIIPEDAITVDDLAAKLVIDKSTALRLLKKDVRDGYLISGTKPLDKSHKLYFWRKNEQG